MPYLGGVTGKGMQATYARKRARLAAIAKAKADKLAKQKAPIKKNSINLSKQVGGSAVSKLNKMFKR